MSSIRASDGSPRRSIHERIAHDIGSRIASGQFGESAVLPTEVALAEQFRVSRTAVREAFRMLAAKGLTQSRPKIGTRVRPRGDWNMLDPDVLGWHLAGAADHGFVEAVFDLRALVEPEAAALAAGQRSEAQLLALTAAAQVLRRPTASPQALRTAEVAFLRSLLEASGNLLFRSFGNLSELLVNHTYDLAAGASDGPAPSWISGRRHAAAVAAIRAGDPDAARLAVASMVADARETVAGLRAAQPDARKGG